jgi:hypothetical protein
MLRMLDTPIDNGLMEPNRREEQQAKPVGENQRWHEMQEQFRKDGGRRSMFRRAWDALVGSPDTP